MVATTYECGCYFVLKVSGRDHDTILLSPSTPLNRVVWSFTKVWNQYINMPKRCLLNRYVGGSGRKIRKRGQLT